MNLFDYKIVTYGSLATAKSKSKNFWFAFALGELEGKSIGIRLGLNKDIIGNKRDTDLPQSVPEVLHIAEGGQAVLLYGVIPLGVHLVTGVNILPEISTREGD